MSKKPCIQCDNECEIYPVMLGDAFTLTYLRLCGPECLFLQAYDYLYSKCQHKDFRNHLYELQDEDDKKERDEFIEVTSNQFLEDFGKHLAANSNLLSTPVPQGVLDMFKDVPQIPRCSGPMRFTRPSKEDRLRWQEQLVQRLRTDLEKAEKEWEEMQNAL